MEEFIKYRSFNDKAVATELCKQLSEKGIPFKWESTEGFFDPSFTTNDILNLYYVRLRKEDFTKADELLMISATQTAEEPVSDYYLLSFSNDELIGVLKNPDEWNEFDLYWAKKILDTKGIVVTQEEVDKAKVEKLEALKRPWQLDKVWIVCVIALWVAAFWFVHIFLALAVIFTGGYISFSRKTMPDGERVKAFSTGDRFLGKITLATGIALALFILMQYYGIIDFIHPF
jgi:hypothetical protein